MSSEPAALPGLPRNAEEDKEGDESDSDDEAMDVEEGEPNEMETEMLEYMDPQYGDT